MSPATTSRSKVDVSYEAQLDVPRTPVVVCAVPELGDGVEVIRAAAGLAARLGAAQVLVYTRPAPLIAAEPQIAFASPQPDAAAELRKAARELARIAAAAGAGEDTRIHAAFGNAERSLLEIAEREAAAFILVGFRGLSRSLVERATCPVLVIPDAPARDAPVAPPDWGEQPMAGRERPGDGVAMSPRKENHMARPILCGVDGSADARLALRTAARLAEQLDARLVVAHVVQLPPQSSRLGPKTIVPIGAALEAGVKMLERLLDEEGLSEVDQRVEYGFAADRLADLADEEDAELIVVGSRGRGAFKAAFLGSVSTDVIGVARRPVLVVPPGADAGAAAATVQGRERHASVH
ncbi:MAG TPA: universal stress protein [Gaiellaceae bacterium]|nr:universal stress protein [Gaiellaceae bacterium]